MKRIYALIVMLLAAIPCMAQIWKSSILQIANTGITAQRTISRRSTPQNIYYLKKGINSKYGHGDFGNDLKHLRENYYGLFLKEWGKYYFTIAKGKISKIEFISTTLSNLR